MRFVDRLIQQLRIDTQRPELLRVKLAVLCCQLAAVLALLFQLMFGLLSQLLFLLPNATPL